MKFFQNVYNSKFFWPVVIVLFFGVLASRTLLFQSGYFNMHDDLQMMRQLVMEKCFADGQIPCRWSPDMGYGFGFPLFNFYPPLPYLIGQGIRLLGATFVATAKLTFALSIIISGVTMYFLANEFLSATYKFKGKEFNLAAIVASVFYIWAPYHAVDVYVRGAMNEAWGLTWMPLILWSGYRLIASSKKQIARWIIVLAISWFALLTSHNLMVVIFGPVFAAWTLLWLLHHKRWARLPQLIIAGALSFGLAAFFTIPAVLENVHTHIGSVLVGYYDYTVHFANINQIFISRFWGYGPSVWLMKDDRMSFSAGHLHWGVALVVTGMIVARIYKSKPRIKTFWKNKVFVSTMFMVATGFAAAFMVHQRSEFVWQLFPPFGYVQFPWRFLTIVILGFSFAVGALPVLLKDKKKQFWTSLALIVALLVLNWNYFLPEYGKMGPLTDEEKFSGKAWELQQTAGIYDYLPKSALEAPTMQMDKLAEVYRGEGRIVDPVQGTDWAEFSAVMETNGTVKVNIIDFPDWTVVVDGQDVAHYLFYDEEWGRISFDLPKGTHEVRLELRNTAARKVANLISLVFWLGLLAYPLFKRK